MKEKTISKQVFQHDLLYSPSNHSVVRDLRMDCKLTGQRFPHGFSFHNQGSESSAKSSLPTISEKLYDDLLYKNLPVDL